MASHPILIANPHQEAGGKCPTQPPSRAARFPYDNTFIDPAWCSLSRNRPLVDALYAVRNSLTEPSRLVEGIPFGVVAALPPVPERQAAG